MRCVAALSGSDAAAGQMLRALCAQLAEPEGLARLIVETVPTSTAADGVVVEADGAEGGAGRAVVSAGARLGVVVGLVEMMLVGAARTPPADWALPPALQPSGKAARGCAGGGERGDAAEQMWMQVLAAVCSLDVGGDRAAAGDKGAAGASAGDEGEWGGGAGESVGVAVRVLERVAAGSGRAAAGGRGWRGLAPLLLRLLRARARGGGCGDR